MLESIYLNLLNQYEKNLTLEEKQATMIYKSRFFYFINTIETMENYEKMSAKDIISSMSNFPQFYKQYKNDKQVIETPENMFIKNSVMTLLCFDTLPSFIDSLKYVITLLKQATNKIIVPEDFIIYRGFSIARDQTLSNISKGKIISGTIDFDTIEKFMLLDFPNHQHHLYEIHLEKGSSVLICPYSIYTKSCAHNDRTTIKINQEKRDSQQEIILMKDNFSFQESSLKEKKLEDQSSLYIHVISSKNKNIEQSSWKNK